MKFDDGFTLSLFSVSSEGESEASTAKQQEVTPAKTRTCTGNSRAKQPSAKGVCYFPVLVCSVC